MRLLFSLFSLCLLTSLAHSKNINTADYHYYHAATVKASQIPEAHNRKFEDLSLMVVKDGNLIAIPYQFEEYDELGLIYLDKAAKEDLVGEPNIVDGNDLLVFMYKDSSIERWPQEKRPREGAILKELHFKQTDGQSRYIYLMEGNSQRSNKRYVSYNQAEGEIEGANYFFKFDPKNLAKAEEYRLGEEPKTAPNLFKDSLFELKTSVVFRFMRFTFNSKRNVKMKPIAALHGPVRAPILLKAQSSFFGIPVFTMYTQFNVYEHAMNAPGIEINKPRMKSLIKNLRRAARYLLEPEVYFYVDYQNFDESQIKLERTTRLHEGYGVVDGQYNNYEKAMRQTFLPGQWLWFKNTTAPSDWSVLTTSAVPEEFLDLDGLNPKVIYQDNEEGSRPRVGFKLRGEKVALKELAKGFKLADKFFKDMKPYDLDGIFLAVIDGTKEGKKFATIMEEQNLSSETIQELFDTFQLDLNMKDIAKLVDMGGSYKESITLGEFLNEAGIKPSSAAEFMGMFQMDFNADQVIDDLPDYSHKLMQRLYQGYRDKLKNGITIWTPVNGSNFSPFKFNKLLNEPPRLQ